MTQVVWKWTLRDGENHLELPEGARILTMQMQGDDAQIWALVETEQRPLEQVTVWVVGTGVPLPEGKDLGYIGTVQLFGGALVVHGWCERRCVWRG